MTTLIKKYSNRRLYDTSESRYITQDELAEKIQRGMNPKVVDAKSGEDLTQATLAQLVLESRGASKLLPVPLLMQLIRMDGAALTEFLGYTMSWALTVYQQTRQQMQQAQAFNPFAQMGYGMPQMGMPPWMGMAGMGPRGPAAPGQTQQTMGSSAPPPPGAEPESAEEMPEEQGEGSGDVDALRRELDELKDLMKAIVNKGK